MKIESPVAPADTEDAERIRVRGLVQGVGFRPNVWRLARRYGLRGWVANDSGGVAMHVCGSKQAIESFVAAISSEAPPLARIDGIERQRAMLLLQDADFVIAESARTEQATGVLPDAATCLDCMNEVRDRHGRRYRYPFTNCTQCGPRLSIVESIPYDRSRTTMRAFSMCAHCAREYGDPRDRRFHAQPIACPACGPRLWIEDADGRVVEARELGARDAIEATAVLLERVDIVAIKGLGGFQLACDPTSEATVGRLRSLKHREAKPFALMMRDVETARRFCRVDDAEATLLRSAAAPIVVVDSRDRRSLAASVAPGLTTLGVMLPNTPLHHLLLDAAAEGVLVLTSGNLSDEPQCIDNAEASTRLGPIASHFLLHDRGITRRIDDSVQRVVAGAPRMLRRARGYAPASIRLPAGFEEAPAVLALGGELKNTFCLVRADAGGAEAIVSHHIGDLENAPTYMDFACAVADYLQLFECRPEIVAVDMHPGYLSTQWGTAYADREQLALESAQHHHAHVAACLAENGIPIDHPPVLAVVLDGLGFGDDVSLWGGEFLLADYCSSTRLASLAAVPMFGGAQAIRQPWRSTYAHWAASIGWERVTKEYPNVAMVRYLAAQPLSVLDAMAASDLNSPRASSCGRLFDAAAAAVGIRRDAVAYEGQAAIEFETAADPAALAGAGDDSAYPFGLVDDDAAKILRINPAPMWRAFLDDLAQGTPVPLIAARFHKGLAIAIVRVVEVLRARPETFDTVVLSGGVMQNRVLLEQLTLRLGANRLHVLTHRVVPPNDGGLSLGQAVVAAARALAHTAP